MPYEDDEISEAFQEGYSPRWYLWNGDRDMSYRHNGVAAWVRVVLWGGHSRAPEPDGRIGWFFGDPHDEFRKHTYRVWMNRGESLRIRIGGRPTKSAVGATPTWGSAGTAAEWADRDLQVGGWPDGGNGIEQDMILPEGWTAAPDGSLTPCCTVTVNFRCNGSGGSSRVWLKDETGAEKLVIVEPGLSYGGTPSQSHSSGAWALLNGADTGFPERGNYYHFFRGDGSGVLFELPYPADADPLDDIFGFPPWNWLEVREDHGPAGSPPPGAGSVERAPRPLPASLASVADVVAVDDSIAFDDGRLGAAGAAARGADAQFTALGPTTSGGGGWGGGGGGPALRRVKGRDAPSGWTASGYPESTNHYFSDDYGAEPGHPGGRWWADDLVEQVDIPPFPDPGDLLFLPTPIRDLDGYDAEWQGPIPYLEKPWLFGFGAAWVCAEVPLDAKRAKWRVGHVGWGRNDGW